MTTQLQIEHAQQKHQPHNFYKIAFRVFIYVMVRFIHFRNLKYELL